MRKLIFILPILIFTSWFANREIIGGDWPHLFNETLSNLPFSPPSWSVFHANGLGGAIPSYFLDQYFYFTVFVSFHVFHIPWEIGYKIFWFGAFIFISTISTLYLCKTLFKKIPDWQLALSSFFYTSNTYILMVVVGGQMGIALAYSVAPFVLALFIRLIDILNFPERKFAVMSKLRVAIFTGLALAMQVMFDPRISFLTLIAVFIYFIFRAKNFLSRKSILDFISFTMLFITPFSIVVVLHASWILPIFMFRYNPISDLGSATPTIEGLKFLSFATFPQTFSLLHSNWPENIFGKVGFMRSEFIIMPILAFSSLLFMKIKVLKNAEQYAELRGVLFLAVLGLVGAFLAKGANAPFGEINVLLFKYVPGIGIFRDPSKFYLLIVLSYSFLIPFTIEKIAVWLGSKKQFSIFNFQFSIKSKIFNFKNIFLLVTISYLLFLIHPLILGQMDGTFKVREVPKDYILFKDFINNQPKFFRTLWIPQQQRFSFYSLNHPSVEGNRLFNEPDPLELVRLLNTASSKKILEEIGIKYVIVPFDSEKEIFLKDRKYDEKQYEKIIKEIKKISIFKEIPNFGKIRVFELENPKNHFWLEQEVEISYKMINQAKYNISVSLKEPGNIIFAENYNPYWKAKIDGKDISSIKTKNGLNSFSLKKTGTYSFDIYFAKEEVYEMGKKISFISFFIILILISPWKRLFRKLK